jgi:hypothetical protein
MEAQEINIELLSTVTGGFGGGGQGVGSGPGCTITNPTGQQFLTNPSPNVVPLNGGHGGDHGGHGSHLHHLRGTGSGHIDRPRPQPPRLGPAMGRSDRRLKRNIRSL